MVVGAEHGASHVTEGSRTDCSPCTSETRRRSRWSSLRMERQMATLAQVLHPWRLVYPLDRVATERWLGFCSCAV